MSEMNNIEEIKISELFGIYDYKIKSSKDLDLSKLIILYGDNGCGKTTILKSLFYLLSTVDKQGHKTALAKIRFKELSITISNGTTIRARREEKLIGSFYYELLSSDKEEKSVYLECKKDYSIQLNDDSEENLIYKEILEHIKKLNIAIYYLSDDRNALESITSQVNNSRMPRSKKEYEAFLRLNYLDDSEEKDENIIAVIKKVEKYLKDQIINASKKGEKDSNTIYEDLLIRIEKTTHGNISSSINKKELLQNTIKEIYEENEKYSELGLTEKINQGKLITSIGSDNDIILNILEPYIDSLKVKMNAMKFVYDLITNLLKFVNEAYFSNKKLMYTINGGFIIVNRSEEIINPEKLSSGEKQLLLLFFNTILASQKASILIIDEPEISLNIKWQRKLLDTLLSLNLNNNIQFIVASHSFEILSSHETNIVKLEN